MFDELFYNEEEEKGLKMKKEESGWKMTTEEEALTKEGASPGDEGAEESRPRRSQQVTKSPAKESGSVDDAVDQ